MPSSSSSSTVVSVTVVSHDEGAEYTGTVRLGSSIAESVIRGVKPADDPSMQVPCFVMSVTASTPSLVTSSDGVKATTTSGDGSGILAIHPFIASPTALAQWVVSQSIGRRCRVALRSAAEATDIATSSEFKAEVSHSFAPSNFVFRRNGRTLNMSSNSDDEVFLKFLGVDRETNKVDCDSERPLRAVHIHLYADLPPLFVCDVRVNKITVLPADLTTQHVDDLSRLENLPAKPATVSVASSRDVHCSADEKNPGGGGEQCPEGHIAAPSAAAAVLPLPPDPSAVSPDGFDGDAAPDSLHTCESSSDILPRFAITRRGQHDGGTVGDTPGPRDEGGDACRNLSGSTIRRSELVSSPPRTIRIERLVSEAMQRVYMTSSGGAAAAASAVARYAEATSREEGTTPTANRAAIASSSSARSLPRQNVAVGNPTPWPRRLASNSATAASSSSPPRRHFPYLSRSTSDRGVGANVEDDLFADDEGADEIDLPLTEVGRVSPAMALREAENKFAAASSPRRAALNDKRLVESASVVPGRAQHRPMPASPQGRGRPGLSLVAPPAVGMRGWTSTAQAHPSGEPLVSGPVVVAVVNSSSSAASNGAHRVAQLRVGEVEVSEIGPSSPGTMRTRFMPPPTSSTGIVIDVACVGDPHAARSGGDSPRVMNSYRSSPAAPHPSNAAVGRAVSPQRRSSPHSPSGHSPSNRPAGSPIATPEPVPHASPPRPQAQTAAPRRNPPSSTFSSPRATTACFGSRDMISDHDVAAVEERRRVETMLMAYSQALRTHSSVVSAPPTRQANARRSTFNEEGEEEDEEGTRGPGRPHSVTTVDHDVEGRPSSFGRRHGDARRGAPPPRAILDVFAPRLHHAAGGTNAAAIILRKGSTVTVEDGTGVKDVAEITEVGEMDDYDAATGERLGNDPSSFVARGGGHHVQHTGTSNRMDLPTPALYTAVVPRVRPREDVPHRSKRSTIEAPTDDQDDPYSIYVASPRYTTRTPDRVTGRRRGSPPSATAGSGGLTPVRQQRYDRVPTWWLESIRLASQSTQAGSVLRLNARGGMSAHRADDDERRRPERGIGRKDGVDDAHHDRSAADAPSAAEKAMPPLRPPPPILIAVIETPPEAKRRSTPPPPVLREVISCTTETNAEERETTRRTHERPPGTTAARDPSPRFAAAEAPPLHLVSATKERTTPVKSQNAITTPLRLSSSFQQRDTGDTPPADEMDRWLVLANINGKRSPALVGDKAQNRARTATWSPARRAARPSSRDASRRSPTTTAIRSTDAVASKTVGGGDTACASSPPLQKPPPPPSKPRVRAFTTTTIEPGDVQRDRATHDLVRSSAAVEGDRRPKNTSGLPLAIDIPSARTAPPTSSTGTNDTVRRSDDRTPRSRPSASDDAALSQATTPPDRPSPMPSSHPPLLSPIPPDSGAAAGNNRTDSANLPIRTSPSPVFCSPHVALLPPTPPPSTQQHSKTMSR